MSVGSNTHMDDDDNHMSSISAASVPCDNLFDRLAARASAEPTSNSEQPPTENGAEFNYSAGCVPITIIPSMPADGCTTPTGTPINPNIPKGRNHHCHEENVKGKAVFVSLDVEHGADSCGVLQLSAEIVRMKIVRKGKKTSEDRAESIERGTVFNEYINPG